MVFHLRLEQGVKTINIKLTMTLIKDIIIYFAFFLSLTITSFAQDSVIYYSKIPPEKEYLWNDTVKPYLLKITNEKITLLLDSVESYTNNCEFCHLPCYTTIRPMKSYLGYNNWRITVEQLDNLSGIEYWWKSGTIYGVFYYKEKLYFVINLQATDVEIANKFFSRTPYKKNIYINDETFKKWISSFKFISIPDRKDRNINSSRDWEEINIHPFDYLELLFKENENDFSVRVEQPCVPLNKKDKDDEK